MDNKTVRRQLTFKEVIKLTNILINNTDITDYIAANGVKWSRNDVDGPNTGRTISGALIRDRVATKIRLDVTCRPLLSEELAILLNLIVPEFVEVTYDDPMYGRVTKTMYANNNGAEYLFVKPDGKEYWRNVTFPLIEK